MDNLTTSLSPTRLIVEVLDNIPFGEPELNAASFHALTLKMPSDLLANAPEWAKCKAGQFLMIRPLSWKNEVLCARPFSIARLSERGLIIFFQTAGEGTKMLSQLKQGEKVVIWGPLGTSFEVDETKETLLISGGIGIVPFVGYLDQIKQKSRLSMLFSHRAPSECYPIDTLSNVIEVEEFYEKKPEDLQTFLDAVKTRMLEIKKVDGLVLACGPMPLLKYIYDIAQEHSILTQVSLENKMACGVGACLGCVAKTSSTWNDKSKAGLPVQTCTKGPVFWTHDLDL